MSTLLSSLGRWSYRHPWRVLGAWLALLTVIGVSALTFMSATDDAFTIPGTESQAGIEALERTFPQASGSSAQLIVVAPEGMRVDEPPLSTDIDDLVAAYEDVEGVIAVTSPFTEMVAGLVTEDADAAIVQMQFEGAATEVSDETLDELRGVAADARESFPDGTEIALGGDLFSKSLPALSIVEVVGVIVALIVLVITFRSMSVAWFPLVSALVGVGLAMASIYGATAFTSISSVTPMLALMLGLAVGIDYALFIVSRHQDQVRRGVEPEESAARATGTAGSAVVFAGVTVLIALIGLGFAGIPFLTTMGIAAAVAVAIAVFVAVTLTPALLGFAKHRVAGWPRRTQKQSREGRGIAQTWIGAVTRHPIIATLLVVVTLGAAALPAANMTLALPNGGVQAPGSEARVSYDLTEEHFGPGFNGPLVMTGTIVTSTDPLGLMDDLAAEIEQIDGVKEVALATPNETADTALIQIVPETAPDDPATSELVRDLRAEHDRLLDEYGVDLTVTGFTAVGIDVSDQLGAALLPFGIFVIGLSFVLLMIVFRSIWVPLKAALGYLLSIGAAFGAVVVVFEWGWLADVLHVYRVGPVLSFMPIILMGVLFGLAMDYEVFLVSRMREDYVHGIRAKDGRSPRQVAVDAVRSGFTASARVVVAAALIMFAVFAAFVPEGDSSIKPIALGLAVGIAVDAFLVRMTLGPAVMALLGDKAWWMPRWLGRLLPRVDIEGEAVERERELAAWATEPDTAIAAEDLAVEVEGRRAGDAAVILFADADVRVETGGTLLVTADDPRSARAFLLTVAGRVAPTEGHLRVAGHLLPGRGAWVRRHVGVALLADGDAPVRRLEEAVARGGVVVVDGIDALDAGARDQAAAVLRDASARFRDLTLVVSTRDLDAARRLVGDGGRRDLTTLDLHPSPVDAQVIPS